MEIEVTASKIPYTKYGRSTDPHNTHIAISAGGVGYICRFCAQDETSALQIAKEFSLLTVRYLLEGTPFQDETVDYPVTSVEFIEAADLTISDLRAELLRLRNKIKHPNAISRAMNFISTHFVEELLKFGTYDKYFAGNLDGILKCIEPGGWRSEVNTRNYYYIHKIPLYYIAQIPASQLEHTFSGNNIGKKSVQALQKAIKNLLFNDAPMLAKY